MKALKTLVACFVLFASFAAARAGVVAQTPEGGFKATGKTYTLVVAKNGDVKSWTVEGVELLSSDPNKPTRFPSAGGAKSVENAGDKVVAVDGNVRVEFEFVEDGFTFTTEGGSIDWYMGKALTASIQRDGAALPASSGAGNVVKVVASKTAFTVSQGFHLMGGKFLPSHLLDNGKPEKKFTCRVTCGVKVEPIELLSISGIDGAGVKSGLMPMIAAGQTAKIILKLRNLGETAVTATAQFTVTDHPVNPRTIDNRSIPVKLAGGESNVPILYELSPKEPGIYWIKADILSDDKPVKGTRICVVYDANNYRPALTRPADFAEFWAGKLKEMRAVPFEANLVEDAKSGNERFIHYTLEINVAKGKRITTFLRAPRSGVTHDAEVFTHWGTTQGEKLMGEITKAEKQPAGAGMWQRGGDRIRVGAPQPDDSTYKRWNGRDDNNCLDSYLLNVRMADYLRTMKDVERIWLFGGSRSGASMLTAAALSPEKVVAVNVHVPTCCGLSWADHPYAGWGAPPARTPEGLKVAAYFDPVNFAPDLVVPLVVDGGATDGLAPASGILALCNWADKAPFRRCAINQGGHGFFPPEPRAAMEADLAEFLHMAPPPPAKK